MKFQVDDELQIRTCMEEVVAYLNTHSNYLTVRNEQRHK